MPGARPVSVAWVAGAATLASKTAGYGGISFQSSLALLVVLDVLRQEGSQAIVAIHSPLVAALPGATTVELGEWGMRRADWADLDLVESWRDFLTAPQRWLRHLVDPPG